MSASDSDVRVYAEAVVKLAAEKGITISTAESCTGGGIGAAITGVSGASSVYPGGIISYANEVKIDPLGVPEALLVKHGAVSEEVALAMAKGAVKLFKSDIAVSVTGIAGPSGGTEEKPVGLIHIAIAKANGQVRVKEFRFGDIGRAGVRLNTVIEALCFLGKSIQ